MLKLRIPTENLDLRFADTPTTMATAHAPAGYTKKRPFRVGTHEFKGGQFITKEAEKLLTPEQRKEVVWKNEIGRIIPEPRPDQIAFEAKSAAQIPGSFILADGRRGSKYHVIFSDYLMPLEVEATSTDEAKKRAVDKRLEIEAAKKPKPMVKTPEPPVEYDLFGDPIYNAPGKQPKAETGSMFANGLGWQTQAENYARERGEKIDEIKMDQTFRIGDQWFEVKRDPETETLEVVEKQSESPVSDAIEEDFEAEASAPAEETVIRYTTAPREYDGFGTETLEIAGKDAGKTVRKVEIQKDHLDWQESRYGSGMHGSLDESKWQKLVDAGIATAGQEPEPPPAPAKPEEKAPIRESDRQSAALIKNMRDVDKKIHEVRSVIFSDAMDSIQQHDGGAQLRKLNGQLAALEERKKELATAKPHADYESFKKEYVDAFKRMMGYSPKEVGAGHYTDKMVELADLHPDWAERAEAEAKDEVKGQSANAPLSPTRRSEREKRLNAEAESQVFKPDDAIVVAEGQFAGRKGRVVANNEPFVTVEVGEGKFAKQIILGKTDIVPYRPDSGAKGEVKPAKKLPANMTPIKAAGRLGAIRNDRSLSEDERAAQIDELGEWLAQQKNTPLVEKLLKEARELQDKLRGGSGKGGNRLEITEPDDDLIARPAPAGQGGLTDEERKDAAAELKKIVDADKLFTKLGKSSVGQFVKFPGGKVARTGAPGLFEIKFDDGRTVKAYRAEVEEAIQKPIPEPTVEPDDEFEEAEPTAEELEAMAKESHDAEKDAILPAEGGSTTQTPTVKNEQKLLEIQSGAGDQGGVSAKKSVGTEAQGAHGDDVSGTGEGARAGDGGLPASENALGAPSTGATGGRGDSAGAGAEPSLTGIPGGAGEGRDANGGMGVAGSGSGDIQRGGELLPKTPAEESVSEPPTEENPTDLAAGNFRYDSLDFATGGKKEKFRANLAAIKTMQAIRADGRTTATPEEQAILSKYVGWGQFAELFNPRDYDWRKERTEFKSLIGAEEYESAKAATVNSHFTSPGVVEAHWRMAQRLGFNGGKFLEPSAGIGYYFGLMPKEIAARTAASAVELDTLTGDICQLLYPNVKVKVQGFETHLSPPNFYDLIASNVPFDENGPYDPDYAKFKASLHDYFFLKSMEKLRPGGLMMHITSPWTMDKEDSRIREELFKDADLVAAIRFPGSTHKENAGTDVVTDMLILRKRDAGEKPADVDWMKTVLIPDPLGGPPIPVNKYFADHPEQILGTLDRSGQMRQAEEKGVSAINAAELSEMLGKPVHFVRRKDDEEQDEDSVDASQATKKGSFVYADGTRVSTEDIRRCAAEVYNRKLDAAIARLPEGIYKPKKAPKSRYEPSVLPAPGEVQDGGYHIQDGKLYVRQKGALVEQPAMKREEFERIQAQLGLRDAWRAVINKELSGEDAAAERAALNQVYDDFAARYGYTNDKANKKAFSTDPDASVLLGLEHYNPKTKTATKADIFTIATQRSHQKATHADDVPQAVGISLQENGRLDIAHMAKLLGKPVADVGREAVQLGLAFESPSDGWMPAAQYLSGNVREKLVMARAAAESDKRYQANVEALEKVQPRDLESSLIDAKIGSSWIPNTDITKFAAELTNNREDQFAIHFEPLTGAWDADWINVGYWKAHGARHGVGTAQWETDRVSFMQVLDAALNNRGLAVYDTVKSGDSTQRVFNEQETDKARAKVDAMKKAFRSWVWEDDSRRERLTRFYNDNFNNIREMQYDGSHLKFPGMNPAFKPRDFQRNFVWQAITTGTGLMAHGVGSGKTATMIASAMEMRRLGLAKKPAIVCLKSNIEQITNDARYIYPGAKIISLLGQFDAQKRRKTIAQIASGDYDMVIMTHDNLDMLRMRPEVEQRYIQEELNELETVMYQATASTERGKDNIVKALEKQKKALKARLQAALDPTKKDKGIYFEDTGIDQIFVDECFPGRTMVETDHGPIKISDIVEQKMNVLALSCNRASGEIEYKPVVSWFTKQVQRNLVKVTHEHGHFICTSNHKIWTQEEGYVEAGILQSHHTLSWMSEGFSGQLGVSGETQALQQSVLRQDAGNADHERLSPLQTAIHAIGERWRRAKQVLFKKLRKNLALVGSRAQSEGYRIDARGNYGGDSACFLGADEKEQSYGQSRNKRKSQTEADRSHLSGAWRQRAADRTTEGACGYTLLADRVCHRNGSGSGTIPVFAEFVQGRSGESSYVDCNRDRRPIARAAEMEISRQAENRNPRSSRVVSVTLHQRAGDARTVSGDVGDSVVYDIEVEGTHNYFADGVNVSNCHKYKSLNVLTKQTNIKGVPTNKSQKAANMLMRCRWLQEQNGGRGVVFATGTPVANTMAELYNLQRYLQPAELKKRGIHSFDAWASVFGDIESKQEKTVSGSIKQVSRFSKFTNVAELMQIARQMMDVQRVEDMKQPNPDGGPPIPLIPRPERHDHVVIAPETPEMESLIASLQERASNIRGFHSADDDNKDNMLVICTDGRKGAMDMRLLDPNAKDNPESKVNMAVRNILEVAKEKPGMTQLIFSDVGVHPIKKAKFHNAGGNAADVDIDADEDEDVDEETKKENAERAALLAGNPDFHLYGSIIDKLVAGGIPRDQIADFTVLKGKAKEEAQDALNEGKIKIAIGSTQKLGTGVNVQKRVAAMHHLDVPWLPADIEQRDGRGWRFKNQNKDIDVYTYVSEGSLDETFWQFVARKQGFIRQVMNPANKNIRTFEDTDTERLSFEQFMAAASGDPRIMRKVQLADDVRQLEAARENYDRDQRRFKREMEEYPREIARIREEQRKRQVDADELSKHQKFEMEVDGEIYTERAKAAEAVKKLAERLDQRIPSWAESSPSQYRTHIGSFHGYEIERTGVGDGARYEMVSPNTENVYFLNKPTSGDYVADSIRRWIAEDDETIKKQTSDVEKIKGKIGAQFEQASEFEHKVREYKDIEADLAENPVKKKKRATMVTLPASRSHERPPIIFRFRPEVSNPENAGTTLSTGRPANQTTLSTKKTKRTGWRLVFPGR